MTKKFFVVGIGIGTGTVTINSIIYWLNSGFSFSWDIIGLSCPTVIFSWITMAACAFVVRRSKSKGAVLSALLLLGIHAAAILYFAFAFFNWREGTEFAQLFLIHLTFAILVLFIWIVRPIIKTTNHASDARPEPTK